MNKELLKFHDKEITNHSKIWEEDLSRHFSKQNVEITNP